MPHNEPSAQATDRRRSESARRDEFVDAQARLLARHGIETTSHFVEVPQIGGRAHVLVAGEGPPVVMVIGGGMVGALWAPLMEHLEGFTLYAVDPPGTGLSDPAGFRRGQLRSIATGFLEGVLEGLDLSAAPFVGSSMGGLWSTWLALDRPGRVESISLVGCPALLLGTSAPLPMRLGTIRPLHWLMSRLDPPTPKSVERMARMAGEDLSARPEVRDVFLAAQRLPDASQEMLDLVRTAIRVRGARHDVALGAAELRRVRIPVQLIWGEHDPFGPPEVGRRAAELLPQGEFHLVPGGHGPWFCHADDVGAALLRFLRQHRPYGVHHERSTAS